MLALSWLGTVEGVAAILIAGGAVVLAVIGYRRGFLVRVRDERDDQA